MKQIAFGVSTAILLLVTACHTPTKTGTTTTLPQLGKSSTKEVINAMTLDEKANFVIGMGFFVPGLPDNIFPPVAEVDKNTPEKSSRCGRSDTCDSAFGYSFNHRFGRSCGCSD